MKQIFSIVSALVLSATMFAQTIAIDGANADWANVPMLTEPGVGTVVKILVPQDGAVLPDGAAFALMVDGKDYYVKEVYPKIFVDADKNKATNLWGGSWYCPTMGEDYEMATWSDGTLFANSETGNIHEMCIMKSAYDKAGFGFDGSIWAVLCFFKEGEFEEFIPAATTADWKSVYRPFIVGPTKYVYNNLAGTHSAAGVYATHSALPMGKTLQMSTTSGMNDTTFWAAWTVELKKAATYTVSANVTAINTTSLDLSLVDVATNKVVATFTGADVWAPTGATTYGEWDLSKVPAGKYILKAKNHVQWSDMALTSVTLIEKGVGSAVEDVVVNTKATKVIKNGQMMIVRDNVQYNVLGGIVK